MNLQGFKTWVFDCDGVLLDSNAIKTQAFHDVAIRYGAHAADSLVAYHVAHGGVSRYRKFEYLLGDLLGLVAAPGQVEQLAGAYGERVCERLMHCPVAPGLQSLRDQLPDASWMVVSGGAQAELRHVFARRGLDSLFDAGIHGSPATKHEILASRLADGTLKLPALFLGDSRYDHEAAVNSGLEFVFVHGWTEFAQWRQYCEEHRVPVVPALQDLLPVHGDDVTRASAVTPAVDQKPQGPYQPIRGKGVDLD